jgi:hypothetical protein
LSAMVFASRRTSTTPRAAPSARGGRLARTTHCHDRVEVANRNKRSSSRPHDERLA